MLFAVIIMCVRSLVWDVLVELRSDCDGYLCDERRKEQRNEYNPFRMGRESKRRQWLKGYTELWLRSENDHWASNRDYIICYKQWICIDIIAVCVCMCVCARSQNGYFPFRYWQMVFCCQFVWYTLWHQFRLFAPWIPAIDKTISHSTSFYTNTRALSLTIDTQ